MRCGRATSFSWLITGILTELFMEGATAHQAACTKLSAATLAAQPPGHTPRLSRRRCHRVARAQLLVHSA